jgi:phosphoserine aminotransferase
MKTHYLSPGPSRLPEQVRKIVHEELLDTFGIDVSVMEISHRSDQYVALSEETLSLVTKVLQVPESHAVILTPFGAQQHFSLLIHHLSLPGDTISYVNSGIWAGLAVKDARASGRCVDLVFDGDPSFSHLGDPRQYRVAEGSRYLHLTVNNTVYGTEYPQIPDHFSVPLVLDMTSSLAARCDIPWNKVAVVYASAQKNFGIAGCSIVIVRKDVLDESCEYTQRNYLGDALSYHQLYAKRSALNTPPVFPIFVANRYFKWMESQGGVPEMERRARQKAALVYAELDGAFFKGRSLIEQRSRHNFVFDLPNQELVDRFIQAAAAKNILEIRGYRSVGGIRASFYNGVNIESAKEFANLMREFRDIS